MNKLNTNNVRIKIYYLKYLKSALDKTIKETMMYLYKLRN
jgi:hypothetical protein